MEGPVRALGFSYQQGSFLLFTLNSRKEEPIQAEQLEEITLEKEKQSHAPVRPTLRISSGPNKINGHARHESFCGSRYDAIAS